MNSEIDWKEVEKKVINALSQGATISAAALEAGIHRSTIYRWLSKDACFRDSAWEAIESQTFGADDQLTDISRTAISVVQEVLAASDAPRAQRLRAALAILTRSPRQPWHRPNVPTIFRPENYRPDPEPELSVEEIEEQIAQEPHFRIPRPWATKGQ